jgi:hypothetical protein
VFLLVGLVLFVAAVVVASNAEDRSERLAASGERVAGEVVDTSSGLGRFSEGWIVVRFDVGEVEQRKRINLNSDSPDYDVGDEVTVIYDPSNLSNLRTTHEENDSGWAVWVFVISFCFGIAGLGIGVAVLRRSTRWRWMASAAPWREVAAEYREIPVGRSVQPVLRVSDGGTSVVRGLVGTGRWRLRTLRGKRQFWALGNTDSRFVVATPGGVDLFEARPARTKRGRRRWAAAFDGDADQSDA